ncbi:MAG TPA: tRNA (guanosine(37)-N1)-methyltransferase TrmD [Bacilli bacterium]|nr:tRNA (guanosine(37)-N1)-methyltransferase TrmD [Bacilli bacterium]
MKIDILSLFPEMFTNIFNESIIKRAIDKKLVEINVVNFREFSKYNNNQVDDTPYGGGAGMVLMCEPIFEAVNSLKTKDSFVILLTPDGVKYNQKIAKDLVLKKHLIIICGHYEGFDERIRTLADMELSLGDFILTGGEIPAMAITDSIIRLIDGVITKESLASESFNDNLLDYPVYTKPRCYNNMEVPEVLLSGNHEKIDIWRNKERIKRTKEKRKDLLK